MAEKAKGKDLSAAEQRDLDRLAQGNEFFGRLRAAYAEWGSLTPRQYEALKNARERDSWRKDALMIGKIAVKNKYETSGKAKCAHRGRPYCNDVATVVVGNFGYCADHSAEARESLEAWKRENPKEKVGGGGGSPAASPRPTSSESYEDRMDRYLGRDDLEEPPC